MRRVSACLLSVCALFLGAVRAAPTEASTERSRAPNILFVLTDDLDLSEMTYLPQVRSLIGTPGATFAHYFVNVSLCCPSRVTTLRGQYAHNTGIETNGNVGTNGGFAATYARGLESDTVATRLQRAGYRTALIGKYLNGYPGVPGPTYVPPGWDTWASPVGGDPYGEYHYTLNENGILRGYGSDVGDYGTSVYVGLTQQFIRRSASEGRPFFAYLALYAPHDPATPAPLDVGRFAGARAPRTPSFDQADVSEMPAYIQALPRLSADQVSEIDSLYEKRLESLQAVDRAVATLVDTLSESGQLDNTYVVFTSDNGYHLGQHRLPAGKQTAYDTDTHVPLLVRGPGIRQHDRISAIAGNVDLAPTFADIAGAAAAGFTDGRSLLPMLRGDTHARRRWRNAYLLEHWRERGVATGVAVALAARGPLEPSDLDQSTGMARAAVPPSSSLVNFDIPDIVPDFSALRTSRWLFVEFDDGERELYDLRADPDQIHNLAGRGHAERMRNLSRRLTALRACRAAACRVSDSQR